MWESPADGCAHTCAVAGSLSARSQGRRDQLHKLTPPLQQSMAYLDISSSYNLEDSQSFLDFGPAKANPDRLPDRPGFDVRGRLQPVVVKRRRYGVRLGRGWKKTTRRGEGRTFLHTPRRPAFAYWPSITTSAPLRTRPRLRCARPDAREIFHPRSLAAAHSLEILAPGPCAPRR